MNNKPPNRRYEMTIKIGADSVKDISHALDQLDFWLSAYYEDETSTDGVSAGWSSSWSYRIDFDPDMDGDTYRERIDKWVKEKKESKNDTE